MHRDMTHRSGTKGGIYLYAIAPREGNGSYSFSGIDGQTVYAIADGDVLAIVSDVADERMRPERRHLAAHQQVLRQLMARCTVLPMTFGIIAGGRGAIERILLRNQEAFVEQLRRVADRFEMGLRVTWDAPNIFEYFVNTHAELRAARDRLIGAPRQPAQDDKIELGRMFDRILNEDREACTAKVEKVLSRHCDAIKQNPCRNEREVMNLACLVERRAREEFETGVFAAAHLFDHNFAFDYHGPWAPHNFVEMNLEL